MSKINTKIFEFKRIYLTITYNLIADNITLCLHFIFALKITF